ncbi:hypothetical protein FOA43_004729 [Brettanomyces nanus]|uniref:Uncharacterized protein n=1 Tax=Eeniella nana TaxID=13502 RepID=A0A875RQK9_EENNA|nr:uncharacterized protein FOA43_004729 [Brettanomyces nanus]QPG77320.1 hypothetical protein FOA43_004729 [Brettanomyces nanus]
MSSIDINRYISRLRDKLDSLVDEFREYDFTFKPLFTQQEFEEQILPQFDDLMKLDNRYLIIYNIFSNLLLSSLTDFNKLLCIIDFLINVSKCDPDVFASLPNDIVKEIALQDVFQDLKKYLYSNTRMDYKFDKFNSTQQTETEGATVPDTRRYPLRRPPVHAASLAAIEKTIMGKKAARKAIRASANVRTPPSGRLRLPESIPELRNKKMAFVLDDNLNFLYEKLDNITDFEPELVAEARDGFFYKPPQYKLFSKYDTDADAILTAGLDKLFNSFMQQICKRVGYVEFDSTPFLHETEYQYIMSNVDEFGSVSLAPLIFENRPVRVMENGMLNKVKKIGIKSTKVKGIMRLKVFNNSRGYLKMFGNLVSKDQARSRVEWINSFITDGKGLYSCDRLAQIMSLMDTNAMLRMPTPESSDNEEAEEEEGGDEEDTEEKIRKKQVDIKQEENNSPSRLVESDGDSDEYESAKEEEEGSNPKIPRDSTLFVGGSDGEEENKENQESIEGELPKKMIESLGRPQRGIDDDRTAVMTSARGVKLNSSHMMRHLCTKDFLHVLANLIFPQMKIANRTPNQMVMSMVNTAYSKAYFNFRPYLISLFLSDLDEFFNMPKYFQLDSVMFQLQLEEYRKKSYKQRRI